MEFPTIKKIIKATSKMVYDSQYRRKIIAMFGRYDHLSDEDFITRVYRAKTGKRLDLKNPQTFSEKLQWLKIYDRNPLYTVLADKLLVKDYVKEKIGAEHIVPTIAVWESPDKIDFNNLPSRFVLKCNHNSGLGMCICKNKADLNIDIVKQNLWEGLQEDHYKRNREWPYKDIRRKIFAEELLEDSFIKTHRSVFQGDGLIDYKFYCFNGEPKFLYVGFANIHGNEKKDLLTFLTLEWEQAPFYRTDHEKMPKLPEKPNCFSEMITYARDLSKGIPFVRVDFYVINEKPFFSEFTFYPGGGYGFIHPEEWEKEIGNWITLPVK